ncbi:MAG: T9SS type A sorting domain-containing protein [Bacteroidota bacterium]
MGNSGNLIYFRSSAASVYTLSKSSACVICNYVDLQYCTATGGASWYAANSTNSGSNTNWTWGTQPGGTGVAGVSIAANPNGTLCPGTFITYTASPANGGSSPTYQWKRNGSSTGTNSTMFVCAATNNDNISCIMTSSDQCVTSSPASSNTINVSAIVGNPPVSVSITSNYSTTICPNQSVLFTATGANGGSTPTYQWQINNINVGTSASTFSYDNWTDGDQIKCIFSSCLGSCVTGNPATSNVITMSVSGGLGVAVSIAANPGTTVGAGTVVLFTATPTNEGSSPVYQWKVNNVVVGSNAPTYSYIPLNGDYITCKLTSNLTGSCVTNNPATSNTLTMTVSGTFTYYWIGAQGSTTNWSDGNNWSLSSNGTAVGSVPTSTNPVRFDANSFSASKKTVNIDASTATCASMDWTGATNNPSVTGPTSNILEVYGSMNLVSAMNWSFNGKVYFKSTATGNTITSAGKQFRNYLYFNGIGGEWTLQDALAGDSTLYLYNGSLITNNQAVTAYSFNSSLSNARILDLGSSVFTVTGAKTFNVNFTNMTFNPGTSTIRFNDNSGGTAGISSASAPSNVNFYNVEFTGAAETGTINNATASQFIFNNVNFTGNGTLNGDNTYNDTLSFVPGKTYTLQSTKTQTIGTGGTLSADGTCSNYLTINASGGTQAKFSKVSGTVSISYANLANNDASGGATFNATANQSGTISGWNVTPLPTALYWYGGTGNWNNPAHWSVISGSYSNPGNCLPTAAFDVYFDANSGFTGGNNTVTVNVSDAYCKSMNWSGAPASPVFATTSSSNKLHVGGSLTLNNTMTNNFTGAVYFEATTAGKTIDAASIAFAGDVYFGTTAGGEWTLQDSLSLKTKTLYHQYGTLYTNGKKVSCNVFNESNANTRTLDLGSSLVVINYTGLQGMIVNCTGLTLNSGTSNIRFTANSGSCGMYFTNGTPVFNNIEFTGSNATGYIENMHATNQGTFNNVTFAGSSNIKGNNIFNGNLTIAGNKTATFQSAKTQTFGASGTIVSTGACGTPALIVASTPLSPAIFNKASAMSVDWVTISDNTATGGTPFIANFSSPGTGTQIGWSINAVPSTLYWIVDGGDWNDPAHWSFTSGGSPTAGGCVPTSTNLVNVVFDDNSFMLPAQTVNINVADAYCADMTWTATTNPPKLGTSSSSNNLHIKGSMSFNAPMTHNFTGPVLFEATAVGKTIATAGKVFSNTITFGTAAGGEWTLQDSLISTAQINHQYGILNTNGGNISASSFNENYANPRTLNLSSSIITLSGSGASAFNINANGLTLNSGTSTIQFTNTGSSSLSFTNHITIAFNNVLWTSSSSTGSINNQHATNSGTFNNVSFTGSGAINGNNTISGNLTLSAGKSYTLQSTRTQTFGSSGNLVANGSCTNIISILPSTPGSAAIMAKSSGGSISGQFLLLQDNTANGTGGVTFTASNSITSGTVTGWTFTPQVNTLYWVGGSGDWNDPAHWSICSGIVSNPSNLYPTFSNNASAIFDAASFSGSGQYVRINVADAYCNNMDWSAVTYTPDFRTTLSTNNLHISGSLALGVMTNSFNGAIYFDATATGKTIDPAGVAFIGDLYLGNAAGGGWTLQNDLTMSSNLIHHRYGSFNTNGKSLNCSMFDENYTNTRNLTLGSSTITINGSGTTAFNINASGLTLDAGTSNIIFSNSGSSSLAIASQLSTLTFNNLQWANTSSTGTINNQHATIQCAFTNVTFAGNGAINGNNTFNGNLSMSVGKAYTFEQSKTQTFGATGDLLATGNCTNLINILSSTGTPAVFSKPTGSGISVNFVNLQNNTAAPGGVTFTANSSNTNNTANWITTGLPATLYWIGDGGNWSDPLHWSLSSGGVPNPGGCIPTSGNPANVIFDAASFTTGSQNVMIDVADAYCTGMDWTNVSNNPALDETSTSNNLHIKGSLTFSVGMVNGFGGSIVFEAVTTGKTITSAGQTYSGAITFGSAAGGEWTLQDDLSCSTQLNHAYGTLITNGKNVSCTAFNENVTNTRTLTLGSSVMTVTGAGATAFNINATGLTLNSGTSTIRFSNSGSSSLAFTSTLTFGNIEWTSNTSTGTINNQHVTNKGTFTNVSFAGSGVINGNNQFDGTLSLTAGKSYTLPSAKTQTFGASGTIAANGTCTNLISIIPSTGGSAALLSKVYGSITVDYVSLQDNTAGGGATFTATNSLTSGTVSGWNFSPAANTFYWIGNNGNWNNPLNWSLCSGGGPNPGNTYPNSTNWASVVFDAASFNGTSQSMTINVADAYCTDMDWTNASNSPVLATTAGTNKLHIKGSLKLCSAMTNNFGGSIYFEATTTGKTITTAGTPFKGNLYFGAAAGGGWTLQDDLSMTWYSIYLQYGSLTTNNKNVDCNIFDCLSTANVRSLILGTSTLTINNMGTQGLKMNCTNLTFSGASSTIRFTNGGNCGLYSTNGSPVFNDIIFTNAASNAYIENVDPTNQCTFNNVTIPNISFIKGNNTWNGNLSLPAGKTAQFEYNKTQTFGASGTLVSNGLCNYYTVIRSTSTPSTATFVKAGGMTVQSFDIKDIIVPATNFTANNSANSGNTGGWTFPAPTNVNQNLYWVGGQGNWYNVNNWSYVSGGAGGACVPGPTDNVYFDAGSHFTATLRTVTVDIPDARCKNMDWTGAAFTPIFQAGSTSNNLHIYGSLTMNASMSWSYSAPVYFESTATGNTIDCKNNNFVYTVFFTGNGGGWTLADKLYTGSYDVYLNYGSLNTNGKTVTCNRFYSNTTNTRSLTLGGSTVYVNYSSNQGFYLDCTNLAFNAGTSKISFSYSGTCGLYFKNAAADVTFYNVEYTNAGSNGYIENVNATYKGIFNNVTFAGGGYIYGNNTYNGTMTMTPAKTYKFEQLKAQFFPGILSANGVSIANRITITSINGSQQATFDKANGCMILDYINLSYNIASGTNLFGGSNSVYSNTTNWNQYSPPGGVLPASVTITSSEPGAICSNTSVTFLATPVNGGTSPTYLWKINGVAQAGSTSTFVYAGPWANGDIVTATLTSSNPCATTNPYTSNSITMNVSLSLTVGAVITSTLNTVICPTSSVTFTAAVTNGGTGVAYQWKKNGVNVGTSNSTYTFAGTWNDGDYINCEINSSLGGCLALNPVTSNTITMSVSPSIPVSVNIAVSPDTNIVAGTIVTFTATPTNGGTNPSYQWKINGANQGSNQPTFVWIYFNDGDKVTCDIVSNLGSCVTYNAGTTSVSNILRMHPTGQYTYYWVNGTGSWTDPTHLHWALSSGGTPYNMVPVAGNDVRFDINSFTGAGQTVTMDNNAACKSMDWTGAKFNPTLQCVPANNNLEIYGSLTLIPAMNFSFSGYVYFKSTSTGNTITSAGKSFSRDVYFNGAGGGWTLQDNLTISNSYSLSLNAGTLNSNNMTINCGYLYSQPCPATARTLTLGSSTVNIYYSMNFYNELFTFNSGTSTIKLTNSGASLSGSSCTGVYRKFDFNNVEFTNSAGTASISYDQSYGRFLFNNMTFTSHANINGNNKFTNLNLASGKTYTFEASRKDTITGILTANGGCGNNIVIKSNSTGTQFTLTKDGGTIDVNYVSLQDSKTAGTATFNANSSTVISNVSGWNITLPPGTNADYYWFGGSGNWSDASHWSLDAVPPRTANPAGCIPGSTNNVFFDASSDLSAGYTVTMDVSTAACKNMDWTGAEFNPTFQCVPANNNLEIYGSLTLIPAMNFSFSGYVYFKSSNTGNTITSAGKSFSRDVYLNGAGGGWTLQDNLTISNSYSLSLNAGTLNSNTMTINCGYLYSQPCPATARTLNLGSSTVSIYYSMNFYNELFTFNSGTSTIKLTNSGASLSGSSCTGVYRKIDFNNVEFTSIAGTASISYDQSYGRFSFNNVTFPSHANINGNNKFVNLNLASGKTYTFEASRKDTITGILTANGTCGNNIVIKSNSPGTQFTLTKNGGTIDVNYVSLQDSKTAGTATFNANSSIALSNVSGWNITSSSGTNADFFWIGGNGSWSDPTHWSTVSGNSAFSSGCIPGSGNNVFFDANSDNSAGYTVTMDVPTGACNNMNWTGAEYNPTFQCVPANNNLEIYGSLTLIPAMNFSFSGYVYFKSSNTGNTITSAGKTFSRDIYFNGAGGGWTLQDNLTISNSYSLSLNSGTLNSNNMIINCGYLYSQPCPATARVLNLGSSTVNIYYSMNFYNELFTFNSGTSTIKLTNSGASISGSSCTGVYRKIDFNNIEFTNISGTASISYDQSYGRFSFNNVSFSSHANINGNNKFVNLVFSAGKTYTFEAGRKDTINGTWTLPGGSGNILVLKTNSPGLQVTIYKPSLCVLGDWMNITDINVTGGAQYYCGPPAHSSIANSPGWHLATSNSLWLGYSTNWNDPANWDLNGAIPNLATKVKLTSCAYNQPVITSSGAYCDSLYIENGGSLILQGSNSLDVYGNWGMQAGGIFNANNGTINFKGNTILDVNAPIQLHGLTIASGNTLTMVGTDVLRVNGDFTNNGTFNPASGKVAFNGSGQQTIKTSGTVFNKIEFNNTHSGCDDLFLTDNLTFSDSANFIHGVLNYSPTTVRFTVPSGGKCNSGNADSYVNGEVIKVGNTAFIFPIGSCYWAPLGIDAPATASTIAATYTSAPSPNGYYSWDMCPGSGLDHTSGVEYWDVTTNNDHPQLTLYWKDGAHSGVNSIAQTEFAHYEDCGGTDHWVKKTGSKGGTASNGWVKSIGLTSYSPVTLGSTTGPNTLPVTMLNFDAVCLGNKVQLNWQTASETNSDYFLVESSTDMTTWKTEGKVSAAGNSSELRNYSFTINQPNKGDNYIRIRQFDFNGLSYKYGPVGTNCAGAEAKVEIFPNPFDEQLNIHCAGYAGKDVKIVIRDIEGRTVYSKQYNALPDENIILDFKYLTPGMYHVEFLSGDKTEYFKVVKN